MSDSSTSEDSRQNTYLHNMQQVTRYLFAPMTKSLSSTEQVKSVYRSLTPYYHLFFLLVEKRRNSGRE
jgi:hypothetical protein